jgi:hypothetical protein
MRFTTILVYSERDNKASHENAYDLFDTIPRIELGLKQVVVCTPRCLQNRDSKQTDTQKFQDDFPPFRRWIDSLVHNQWVARCWSIMLGRSFKYLTITTITHDLENKVLSTKTSRSPDIAKVVEKSEN